MEITEELELEDILEEARRDKEAFDRMISHPRVKRILDEVAAWAAREFKQEKDEIRDVVVRKLYANLGQINNPRNLKSWCYSVARNYCCDRYNRSSHEVPFLNEASLGVFEGKKYNGASVVQNWAEMTFEEERRLTDALLKAIKPLPKELVQAFADGKKLREIAAQFGVSIPTAQRKLTRLQKAIADAVMEALELEPKNKECDFRKVAEIAMEILVLLLPNIWAAGLA